MGLSCSALSKRQPSLLNDSNSSDDIIINLEPENNHLLINTKPSLKIKEENRRLSLNHLIPFQTKVTFITDHWSRPIFSNNENSLFHQKIAFQVYEFANWLSIPENDQLLTQHDSRVLSAALSSDGRYFYTGSQDRFIGCWDLCKGIEIDRWLAHKDSVLSLAHHRRGYLASGSADNTIRLWRHFDAYEDSRDPWIDFIGHSKAVTTLCFDNHGYYLVSGSVDSTLRVWDTHNGCCIQVFSHHSRSVSATLFAGKCLISGSYDHSVIEWDYQRMMNPLMKIRHIEGSFPARVFDLAVNCDESILACVLSGGIWILELPNLQKTREIKLRGVECASFHPVYPEIMAVGFNDNGYSVSVLSVGEDRHFAGDCVCKMDGHSSTVRRVFFTLPKGDQVLSVSDDGSARMWDLTLVLGSILSVGKLGPRSLI